MTDRVSGQNRIEKHQNESKQISSSRPPDTITDFFQETAAIGQYQLQEKLGQGGMGSVFKARHTQLDKIVAIKLLPADRMENSAAVSRFQREMRAVAKIEHANLVRALDGGESEGVHFLVMEYVDGIDLSQVVKNRGPLPIAGASELIRQAAYGLEAAHLSGMVHRDIKPANLMVSRQEFGPPVVKVLDLGLALLGEGNPDESVGLTSAGMIMGTFDYMAPEQASDSHSVDQRADIYSLGASLFSLLTGQTLFPECKTHLQKLQALATKPIPSIRDFRPDVPKDLARVMDKMLAKDPNQRFTTATEVAEALAPFTACADLSGLLSGESASDPTVSFISRSPVTEKASRPKPAMKLVLTAGLILLVLASFVYFFGGTIIRVATNSGELVVEVKDENVEVRIRQDGVVIFDRTTKREFPLTAGKGRIDVLDKNGIKLLTKEFMLSRGERKIVRVTLNELASARKPKVNIHPKIKGKPNSSIRNKKLERTPDQKSRPPACLRQILSPDQLAKVKPVVTYTFDNPNSGWPLSRKFPPLHGYLNGTYFIRVEKARFTGSWNSPINWLSNFAIEIEGRVKANSSGWGISIVRQGNDPRGIQVKLDGSGKLILEKSIWDRGGFETLFRLLSQGDFKGTEYNKLLVVLRGNKLNVFLNGKEAGGTINLPHDIDPSTVALLVNNHAGKNEPAIGEFEQVKIWDCDPKSYQISPVDLLKDVKAGNWIKLFNGKDFSGWDALNEQIEGQWMIENNAIKTNGNQWFDSLFYTKQIFQDFHLRVKATLGPHSHAGLIFRTQLAGNRSWEANKHGYQFYLTTRDPYPYFVVQPNTPDEEKNHSLGSLLHVPQGKPITIDLFAIDNVFTAFVDDVPVLQYQDEDRRHLKGFLGLHKKRGESVILFHEVQVRELSKG